MSSINTGLDTAAANLTNYLVDQFAMNSPQALLSSLILLSGRTRNPVSGRTVGRGQCQVRLAEGLAAILGESCLTVSTMSPLGLLSLSSDELTKVCSVIHDGRMEDQRLISTAFARVPRGSALPPVFVAGEDILEFGEKTSWLRQFTPNRYGTHPCRIKNDVDF